MRFPCLGPPGMTHNGSRDITEPRHCSTAIGVITVLRVNGPRAEKSPSDPGLTFPNRSCPGEARSGEICTHGRKNTSLHSRSAEHHANHRKEDCDSFKIAHSSDPA